MKILRVLILSFIGIALLMQATPAYADTPLPDSDPTVEQIDIYQHLREDDDMLIVVYANIPFATTPDDPVTETFVWQFVDTDNVTIFGSTTGYVYTDNGYGYNIYSLYLTASEVTTYGIVVGTAYTMRLRGNPTAFTETTPPVYNFPINALDYDSSTTQIDAQLELADRIIELAEDLDDRWGLTSSTTLLQEGEAGTFLSSDGSRYFRGAIYGLQAMAPTVFDVIVRSIEVEARTWSDNYTANLTSMYSGTWVDTARESGGALFGTDYDLFTIVIFLACAIGLMIGNISITSDHWNGFIDAAVFAVIGARLAFYDMGFLILIAALCWFYISAKIWFGLVR